MIKINELIKIGEEELKGVSDRPRLEAELLLCCDLGRDRVFLHINFDKEVEPKHYFRYLAQRKEHIPIEYITKKVSFYNKEFFIDFGALIPRSETEILLEKSIELIKKNHLTNIAEIGTGSGIISIMLLLHFPEINITATDISKDALRIAKINAKKFNVLDNINFAQTSYLDNIHQQFDILISNPPYIAKDYQLQQNVLKEPHIALFGGIKGDEMLKKIIDLAFKRNIKFCALEMGYDQKEELKKYLEAKKAKNIEFYKDLAGYDRGVVFDTY